MVTPRGTAQNHTRAATRMLRSPTPVVEVMNPNVPESEMLLPGVERFGWFSAFSISKRNCIRAFHGRSIERNRPRSTFQKPGPRMVFLGDVPNRCCWPTGMLTAWYALLSKYWYWLVSAPAGGRFTLLFG